MTNPFDNNPTIETPKGYGQAVGNCRDCGDSGTPAEGIRGGLCQDCREMTDDEIQSALGIQITRDFRRNLLAEQTRRIYKIGTRVGSKLVPSSALGTVTAVSVDGRVRVDWDDDTNSSHSPQELDRQV